MNFKERILPSSPAFLPARKFAIQKPITAPKKNIAILMLFIKVYIKCFLMWTMGSDNEQWGQPPTMGSATKQWGQPPFFCITLLTGYLASCSTYSQYFPDKYEWS